ncbi:MAG: hypothetical protein CL867_06170 [Cytophagaceae bacterium]|nr:hypothetical protein [Cytophagaceae bacterium]
MTRMETQTSCNTATLAPYIPTTENPWDMYKVQSLYAKLGFGEHRVIMNSALTKTPQQLVSELLTEARDMPLTPAPDWGYWNRAQFDNSANNYNYYRRQWYQQTIDDLLQNGLRERLTLFWSNHFVTELRGYFSPSYQFQYYRTLQTHALGNFKDFVHDIGLTGAMLLYLNGFQNREHSPNENYARELYELFTLGVNNGYTESDITETAKALTGWNHWSSPWSPIYFDTDTWDNDYKTIFGQTDRWKYDDVIDILFEEKGHLIAPFIARKLYKYFVSPDVNEGIVSELGQVLLDNNFELEPMLETLFLSAHFHDSTTQGVLIKSPVDLLLSFENTSGLTFNRFYNYQNLYRVYTTNLGQELYNPIDGAGWQADENWVDSNTIVLRWDYLDFIIDKFKQNSTDQFRNLALTMLGGNTNDHILVTKTIVNSFLARTLVQDSDYDEAIEVFKGEVPGNYYDNGIWDLYFDSVPDQVEGLLRYITKLPEFQLK